MIMEEDENCDGEYVCVCECHIDYSQNGVRCRWVPSVVVMYLSFWINYNLTFIQLMADVRIRRGSSFAYKMRDAASQHIHSRMQTQCASKESIAVKPSNRRTFLVSHFHFLLVRISPFEFILFFAKSNIPWFCIYDFCVCVFGARTPI